MKLPIEETMIAKIRFWYIPTEQRLISRFSGSGKSPNFVAVNPVEDLQTLYGRNQLRVTDDGVIFRESEYHVIHNTHDLFACLYEIVSRKLKLSFNNTFQFLMPELELIWEDNINHHCIEPGVYIRKIGSMQSSRVASDFTLIHGREGELFATIMLNLLTEINERGLALWTANSRSWENYTLK